MAISEKALKALDRLAQGMLAEGNALDPVNGVRSGKMTDRDEAEPGSEKEWLTITGDELRLFEVACGALLMEPKMEHVPGRRELDALLWRFVCGIVRNPGQYRATKARREQIGNFARAIVSPWVSYTVFVELDQIKFSLASVALDGVTFRTFTDQDAAGWVGQGLGKAFAEEITQLVGRTVAIVQVEAGDHQRAADKAKSRVDRALGVLRYALTRAGRWKIYDIQLLFRRGQRLWVTISEDGALHMGTTELGFRPVGLEVSEPLMAQISATLALFQSMFDSSSSKSIAERVQRAAHWIGASVTRESWDDKIVDLCTALETFLATVADKRKGEAIAMRAMLLKILSGKPFSYPLNLFELYERRSRIVHGADVAICNEQEYEWLLSTAGDLLNDFMIFVASRDLARMSQVITALEEDKSAVANACDWLDKLGSQDATKIADYGRALLNPAPSVLLDWHGNNAAFACQCGSVFIVSAVLRSTGRRRGERVCPACGLWIGRVTGAKSRGGTATIYQGDVAQAE